MRDEEGTTRGTVSWLVEGTCETKIIELLTMLMGLQMVLVMGTHNIIIKSDCLTVV